MAKIHDKSDKGKDALNTVYTCTEDRDRDLLHYAKKSNRVLENNRDHASTDLSSDIGGHSRESNKRNKKRSERVKFIVRIVVGTVVVLLCVTAIVIVLRAVVFNPKEIDNDVNKSVEEKTAVPGVHIDKNVATSIMTPTGNHSSGDNMDIDAGLSEENELYNESSTEENYASPSEENELYNESSTEENTAMDVESTDRGNSSNIFEYDATITRMVVIEVTERKLTPLEISSGGDMVQMSTRSKMRTSAEEVLSEHSEIGKRRMDERDIVEDWKSECEPCEYYKHFWENVTELRKWENITQVRGRLALNSHVLDYTDSDDPVGDTWKALVNVDQIENNTRVRLLYTDGIIASSKNQSGTSERIGRWNREHVWPKGRGVGNNKNDPKHNDIHHLFPSDVATNDRARGNRYFDSCNGIDKCEMWKNTDGNTEVEYETIRYEDKNNTGIFEPPEKVRGVVARAIFYMNVRYSELELVNEPDEHQMGNLSTLLQWHKDYPPNAMEIRRNDLVCTDWQHNRNPFVDFPDLAKLIYSDAAKVVYGEASINNIDIPFRKCDETSSYVPESPYTEPLPGDVMIVGVHSDNPDAVALVALRELPVGWIIRITDNAHDGTSFQSNEGALSLKLSRTIPVGTVFGYGEALLYGESWVREKEENFDLSVRGDTIVVCATLETKTDVCTLLSAISIGGDKSSDLPVPLENFSVVLGNQDNYVYTGDTIATNKESLQTRLMDKDEWIGSNDKTEVPEFQNGFQIIEPLPDTTELPIASSSSFVAVNSIAAGVVIVSDPWL